MNNFDDTLESESLSARDAADESELRFWDEAPRYSIDRIQISLAPVAPRKAPSVLRRVLTKGLFAAALALVIGLLVIEAQAANVRHHTQTAGARAHRLALE